MRLFAAAKQLVVAGDFSFVYLPAISYIARPLAGSSAFGQPRCRLLQCHRGFEKVSYACNAFGTGALDVQSLRPRRFSGCCTTRIAVEIAVVAQDRRDGRAEFRLGKATEGS